MEDLKKIYDDLKVKEFTKARKIVETFLKEDIQRAENPLFIATVAFLIGQKRAYLKNK